MLTRVRQVVDAIERSRPWTSAYGLARTLLALGTMGTLVATPDSILGAVMRNSSGGVSGRELVCRGVRSAGAFCIAENHQFTVVKWVAVALLALVASGYRPRWTGVWHWYVSFSVLSLAMVDGGDQITAVLTLLLVPLTLTDGRRWHWSAPVAAPVAATFPAYAGRLAAGGALLLIRLQVAGLYFHSSVAKMGRAEWADGTAVYYWLSDPSMGLHEPLRGLVLPVLASAWGAALFTWGTVLVELALGLAILLPARTRVWLLPFGVGLHLMIALFIGLTSFSLAMFGALILYLWPADRPLLRRRRAPAPAAEPEPVAPAAAALDPVPA